MTERSIAQRKVMECCVAAAACAAILGEPTAFSSADARRLTVLQTQGRCHLPGAERFLAYGTLTSGLHYQMRGDDAVSIIAKTRKRAAYSLRPR